MARPTPIIIPGQGGMSLDVKQPSPAGQAVGQLLGMFLGGKLGQRQEEQATQARTSDILGLLTALASKQQEVPVVPEGQAEGIAPASIQGPVAPSQDLLKAQALSKLFGRTPALTQQFGQDISKRLEPQEPALSPFEKARQTKLGSMIAEAQARDAGLVELNKLPEVSKNIVAAFVELGLDPNDEAVFTSENMTKAQDLIHKRRVEVASSQGKAAAEIKTEADLNRPLQPNQIALLVDPQTGNKPELGLTLKQAIDRGIEPLTVQEKGLQIAGKSTTEVIKSMDLLVEKLFTSKSILGRLAAAPGNAFDYLLQTPGTEDLTIYVATSGAILPNIVRTFGEKGTLATQDIDRIKPVIPVMFPVPDSEAVARGKMKRLKELIKEISGRKSLPEGMTPYGQDDIDSFFNDLNQP